MLSAGDIKRLLTREGVSFRVAFGTFSHNFAFVYPHRPLADNILAVRLCIDGGGQTCAVFAFAVLDRPSVSYHGPQKQRSDTFRRTGFENAVL